MSNTDRAVEYRQIITKAVCGKGRKFSQVTHSILPPENIHTILGAWVINHTYECSQVGEAVEVRGSYDINIWYSTKGNTKTDVVKETVRYTEQVPLGYYDRNTREVTAEVSAVVTQAPNCVEASISAQSDAVIVRVEKEFMVEMVGETKMCVAVYPLEMAEMDDKESISGYSDEMENYQFEDLDPDLVIDDLDD
ncbi:outer spore coat protein CotE [Paenactinomyces guangxiensis]|uniref:Outer spore coat protein CotE n=1 Tax=Paenactinomyces guangxiensis TaxID=1490290 RepID=A0A7W1WR52_9BACL|nr:outer spore coat protein CotE [Paenactinomyces guangxiensis]MBA4494437.1 outer spore coat protein CotE [Paenactinomyces guangxiensis]MBH8591508.1 outer spore coat protein CotE [Paenactinomyces guangxiensis]